MHCYKETQQALVSEGPRTQYMDKQLSVKRIQTSS